jgi:hypothetical protein
MKNKKIFFIFIIFICILLFLLSNNSIENFNTSEVYDIIVVAGQSNACGAGTRNICDSRVLPGCNNTIDLKKNSSKRGIITNIPNMYEQNFSDIKQFTGNYSSRDASLNNKIIDNAIRFEHIQERESTGVSNSFGYHFATQYFVNIAKPNRRKVLIVGCGYGGSGMNPNGTYYWWRKPNNGDNTTRSLYNLTIERLRTLKNVLGVNNSSKIVAFLWHQGESDSIFVGDPSKPENAILYKSQLKNSLTGIRTSIMGIFNQSYQYPIMLGGLCPARSASSYSIEMSRIISEVSNRADTNYIPKSIFIPTGALSNTGSYNFSNKLEGDSIKDVNGNIIELNSGVSHFSASSNRELGKRYFYFYNRIK